jgi:CubicO group peptidase (beta-lactamase class C family)
LKVIEHGGNIPGFNADVWMIPEKKIGFAILTNVSGSPLPSEMASIIWSSLLRSANSASKQYSNG